MTAFTTPVGRLVQGDCYTANQQKGPNGQPQLDTRTGQPKPPSYFTAVAIPKSDPLWPAFRKLLTDQARAAWPQYFDAAGNCTNPKFADKVIDGDGKDDKGQLYATREGFAGHWVVKCASQYAPKVFEHTGLGWTETATDRVKRGDYIRVSGTCVTNNSQQTPGMYMNLNMVAFEREGAAIVSGPSADEAFGTPGTGAAGAPPPASAGAATPPIGTGAASPPPPNTSFMAPPPPAAKLAPIMGPNANGLSYEAYLAAGWTDAQMIAQGVILDGVPH